MIKNTAGQKWIVFAFNKITGDAVTGDSLNITANLRLDGGVANPIDDTNPAELEGGYYAFDLTDAETNGNMVVIIPTSVTANNALFGVPGAVWTEPTGLKYAATLAAADVSGNLPAQVKAQDNIDFGALQKASITAAVPDVAAMQSGLATSANQTTLLNAIAAVPAAVWAVGTRTLSGFGTLVSDIAAAVWSYATRTYSGVTGSISYAVLSGGTRQDYITAIGHLVGGSLPLGEAEKIYAIGAALKKYSGHRPRIAVEDEDGTGGFDYALTLLTEWADGFSTIKSIEYPVDDSEEAAAILEDDTWQIYQKPSGKVIRFLEAKPVATEDLRVTYTTLHVCTDAACTVPSYDEEALQILAASIFCDMLAAYFAQTQDSTIQADSVDHKSKASEYAARARAYRKMYFDHLGIKEGETPPASVTRDQDTAGSFGSDRATHGKRWR